MEFRLDDGQVELQQTVDRFCTDRFPLDAIVARAGAPIDRAAWSEMADLGVLSLLLPGQSGGADLGAVEAAIVFEQLGSHLVAGPVLWTMLAAPLVDGAATGEQLVAGVVARAVVDGTVVVEHPAEIDVVLVVGASGVSAHRTAELAVPAALDPLDPLTPVGCFSGLGTGRSVGGPAEAEALMTLGRVLCAAMLTGVSSRALDVAREYASERHQFGAPIGSFQAIKHLLADMYVRTVCAQNVTYAAAAVLARPRGGDPIRASASAKLLASDAAITNASTAIQVLGGMGFTWDMLPNFLLKRAWVLEHEFGSADEHELHLGSTLEAAWA